MNKIDTKRVFQDSLQAYRRGQLAEAARGFGSLVTSGSIDPLHVSYYGLMLVLVHRRGPEGLELCERSLLLAPDRPEPYLNLARVHRRMGRSRQATETLREGLAAFPKHRGLLSEIRRASPRRKPPFASLERDHPVNKFLGKLQARLRQSGERRASQS